jgi:Pyruvate/2-oxoacid:ferredoxin oxidoreductase gamma subunit
VALGALIARRRIVEPGSIHAALEAILSQKRPEILGADLAAFEAGYEAAAAVATPA